MTRNPITKLTYLLMQAFAGVIPTYIANSVKTAAAAIWSSSKSLLFRLWHAVTLVAIFTIWGSIIGILWLARHFVQKLWYGADAVSWWMAHQLALTNRSVFQNNGVPPTLSFGWELWAEFNPRHRLDYWLLDSHITVEVMRWSYNQKTCQLWYIETGTRHIVRVHQPQGIQHTIRQIHWWEPTLQNTIVPYFPPSYLRQ